MPIGAAASGGSAASAARVRQQPKPKAFAAFEDYVNASATRLDELINGIGKGGGDKGSDAAFWSKSPIEEDDTRHFLADWIGGGYWVGGGNKGDNLYKKLRLGVRDGARAARTDRKPLRMDLWVDPDATEVVVEIDSTGPDTIINIVTPPA